LRSRASQAGLDKQERMSERSEFASAQSRREAQGTRRASIGPAFLGSFFGRAKNELATKAKYSD
jgi:hypothetical protein